MNSTSSKKIILVIVGILAAAAVVFGVYSLTQSENDKAPTDSTRNETSADNSATENTPGEQTVEGGLVSGFPGDKVPLYLGDVVKSSSSVDSQGRTEYSVRITTSDSFEKVDDWTRTSYVNEGWEIRNDNKTPLGGFMITARSSEYINSITYNENENGVTIDYGITKL